MKYIHFDYGHRLQKYSLPIYNWAQKHDLEFFDFDNCMYSPDQAHLIESHVQSVAEKTKKLIIVEQHPFFDSDEQYTETKTQIIEISNRLNLKLHFLTADYRYWDNILNNECFFPHWYFELRNHAINCNYKNFNWPAIRKYNFSCNNMTNYRSEKIYNYIECFRRHRTDWLLSIYDHLHNQISQIDINQIGNIKTDQITIWNEQIKSTIKMYQYDLLNNEQLSAMSTVFPGHSDSYCNLVMEHSMEIEILSEKSFKPFIAKQIPVYLAQVGACEMLTKLGFDLFYDFINHDHYDNISRGFVNRFPEYWIDRVDQVHKLLDKLYTTNFTDFINDLGTKSRLEKNCEHFYSDKIDQMCIEQFDQLLNKY